MLKARLDYIKYLVEDNTTMHDSLDPACEMERVDDVNGEGAADIEAAEDNISLDCRSESDDTVHGRARNSVPTLEDIHVRLI